MNQLGRESTGTRINWDENQLGRERKKQKIQT